MSRTEELQDAMIGMTTDTTVEKIKEKMEKTECKICGKEICWMDGEPICNECKGGHKVNDDSKVSKM